MAVTFNELLEGAGLSEEARTTIQEAWESRLTEAKEELTAELREEFAQRYEHDKNQIVASKQILNDKEETRSKHIMELPDESLIKTAFIAHIKVKKSKGPISVYSKPTPNATCSLNLYPFINFTEIGFQ